MASAQDLQPTCEDYDSDQSEQGYEFQGRSSANAANVSTKRSHPDDLNKEKPPPQERVPPNLDLRSDSGYSSYTAATVSSTNSAQSASSQRSPPAAAPPIARPEAPPPPPPQPQQQPPPPPSTKTRRPTQSQSEQSRPKLTSRTTSQSSKPLVKQRRPTITQDPRPERSERERTRRDSRVDPECTDPKCTTCGPNALPQHLIRPGIKPTQSARDIDRLSADTRSMRSDPASYYQSPPSPTQLRRPPTYRQEAAIVQPAVAPRRRPSTSRPRPMSYNGEPNSQYYVPGMPAPYPSPPQEHGPPPSNSAQWRHMPQYNHMGGMAPPVVPYGAPQGYPGAYPYNHTPPPYDGPQRPNMPPRTSFNSARNGPAPLITQAPSREQQYSARYSQPQSATQARFPPQLQLQEGAYESDSGSETGSSEEDDDEYYEQPDPNDPRNRRALMAPPPPKIEQAKQKAKSKKQQRPSIRHANTTQVVDERPSRRMSLSQPPSQPQSLVIDERRRKRTSRTIEEPSRRASVSRPAPPSRQIQSEYPSHRGQIVVANSSKSERRRSAQVYEQVYDHHPEEKRASKAAKEARARAREEEEARREQERYEAELAQQKRLNRNSKQYYQPPPEFDSEEESESQESEDEQFLPEAPAPPPPQARRRRPTETGNGKGKERVLEHKTKRIESAAEEYISARRGAREPLNDPIHNAARHSRTISMPSHSGSSGSDRSRSNRTAVTNENNEIRLRVDANAPLSLQFNGDMEGRTLRMIPAENGMADLVISGGRDRESVYHNSDRGSTADDRKALVPKQPRRQAEEMTENSLRSSRRRRDSQVIREQRIERSSGQQRPLRQRAHTSSYYGE